MLNRWTRLSVPKRLALVLTILALIAAAAVVAVWMTQGTDPEEVVDFIRRHVDRGRSRHGGDYREGGGLREQLSFAEALRSQAASGSVFPM